ncbi:SCO7613 C-terminal domain-containing membrane protein [Streptomyces sp. TS71-3]|uniref:SCO7613 C-terminal domain-containing membrane protein n=1 Tax=Streptomyces sp. TS71-3 TaxID=2733862 RepID=UPI001BB32197|nr:hypothetical protein [Streptomyces sp. TS71-3]
MADIPPPAEELRILDRELRQLDYRRAVLTARRAWLVDVLAGAAAQAPPRGPDAGSAQADPAASGAVPPDPAGRLLPPVPPAQGVPPAPAAPPVAAGGGAARPDASPVRVQNVLLVLGGVLLAIAAIAFTLLGWGHLGIAGRSAALAAVTAAALGVPVALIARGLRSTAEAVAGLALALTVLDAYALHQVALPDAGGTGYAAAAAAVLAAGWGAYGLALRVLRVPPAAAVAGAQLPLLLWAVGAGGGVRTITAVLLVTAGLDAVLAARLGPAAARRMPRWAAVAVAVTGCCATGGVGLPAALWLSWQAASPWDAVRAGGLLALGAAVALWAAWRLPRAAAALGAALVGGVALVAAGDGVLRTVLPGAWTVPGYMVCGVVVLAGAWAVRAGAPGPVVRGLTRAGLGVQGLGVLWALPVAVAALLGPLGLTDGVWSGAPAHIGFAVGGGGSHVSHVFSGYGFSPVPHLLVPHPRVAVLVLALAAGTIATVRRQRNGGARRAGAAGWSAGLAWGALLALPVAFELPYGAVVAAALLLTAATLAVAVRAPHPVVAAVATALAGPTSAWAACLALPSETATLVAFCLLTALFAAGAAAARSEPAPVGRVCAGAAIGCAAALAVSAGAAWELEPQHIALLVLLVPAGSTALAARLGRSGPHPLVGPAEVGAIVTGLLAVGLAARDRPVLALVLALCAVLACVAALRPESRRSAGALAAALFVLASWVRLAAWDVDVPEAYGLPVSVPALLIGAVRRRRDRTASSWTAYGAGLGATLLPSLLAAWADAHWIRPLLLGVSALSITLAGARLRLQAPLLLGGGVLAADALHELAPYVAQVAGALPRWLPPALIGLVLLGLGATYEQRPRDVRRIRAAFSRMR